MWGIAFSFGGRSFHWWYLLGGVEIFNGGAVLGGILFVWDSLV